MYFQVSSNIQHFTNLDLIGGNTWNIVAANDRACAIIFALANTMQLKFSSKCFRTRNEYQNCRRISVYVADLRTVSTKLDSLALFKVFGKDIICTLDSYLNSENYVFQLMRLSMVISQDAQCFGGVLIHGALAEWNGKGVILAGPSGIGKTTAIKRLPHNWQSFSDDTTLVICDNEGVYWAHPWPTWSAFMFSGPGGCWNVQYAVPLKGIFFLERGNKDSFEPLGTAENICFLNASAEQTSWLMPVYFEKESLRKSRMQRFNNICNLAQTVPSFILQISHSGSFWIEIERAINV